MAKPRAKNKFVVDLGGLNLTPEDYGTVAAAIQGAVLSHLAGKYPIPTKSLTLIDERGIAGMYIPDPKPEPGPYK